MTQINEKGAKSAADYMRAYRDRRKNGRSLYPLDLPDADVDDGLVALRAIDRSQLDDRAAVLRALREAVVSMLRRA